MSSQQPPKEYIQYHKDGSIWAKGSIIGDNPTGYWEWFRKDGTLMRSGYFREGIQIGEWKTYDKSGNVYKVTDMQAGKKDGKRTIIQTS